MLAQIKILARLELCNLYGFNVLRFSRDRKAKQKSIGLLVIWTILLAFFQYLCYQHNNRADHGLRSFRRSAG